MARILAAIVIQMSANTPTNILSYQEAHQWFFYDKTDGNLYWKMRPSNNVLWGDKVGGKDKKGYIVFQLNGKTYRAHNIIYVMQHGDGSIPPDKTVDHADKNSSNNRIENLRLATDRQQHINKNTRGFCWHKRDNKWQTRHKTAGKNESLGYFTTALQARLAYERHTSALEPEFASTFFTDSLRALCAEGVETKWLPV
jgi:hypothetical protein